MLSKLKLPTLTYRQVRGDMIDVRKFISGKYDINCSVKLQLHSCRGSLSGVETRGNLYKCPIDLNMNREDIILHIELYL